ncbi:MAG: 16S rRNA (uracil(1498)-N(3))-methyltransferase [Planctomycetota bacterium]|jgi:16S rRNA (uracil1498-N3)-methyltransferase|nr:16S rRNA (uracil(1498)-N(3))-methyltransferase [Planctomycetota bacterium]
MSVPWFFTDRVNLGAVHLSAAEARHAAAAKRLNAGDAVTLFDGRGVIGIGKISALGKRDAVVEIARLETAPPPRPLTIATAIPKGKRWQMLVEKLTEIGATKIVPLKFARSVVAGVESTAAERWSVEAGKQARRAWLPVIEPETTLAKFLATGKDADLFLADPQGEKLGDAAARIAREKICLIGPEGGLTPEEVAACVAAGAKLLQLGDYILRVETAAIVAAVMLIHR